MNLRASASPTPTATPNLQEIIAPVADELRLVQEEIQAHIDASMALLADTSHEKTVTGGKLVRPVISLLAGAAVSGREPSWFVELAAAGELAHYATLLHDDVVDEAETRRGKPTVHARWENKVAILVGDYLITQALIMMARYDNARLIRTMLETIQEMSQGELFQLVKSRDVVTTEDEYYRVIRNKTSSLMAAVCRMPAQLAEAPREAEQALVAYGWALGDAFQITDDVLDMTQDESVTGKPAFGDIREGKRTLPVIRMLDVLSQPDAQRLQGMLGSHDVTEVDRAWVLDRLRGTGAEQYAIDAARAASERAMASLDELPDTPYRQALLDLATFVVSRDK